LEINEFELTWRRARNGHEPPCPLDFTIP